MPKFPRVPNRPEGHRAARVRADEIQPGDRYVWDNGKHAKVEAVEKQSTKTPKGATVSRVHITFEDSEDNPYGTAAGQAAPHSKHNIFRPREDQFNDRRSGG